ncbi:MULTISPECIES: DUF4354 family protein [unclassified Serratia (in: enterobacteria)]|uniref:DUF4354 family protein n=1 Tax=unclassified Serratia (in: enterobacteria) TaxID=2647522 RepID=UPI00307620F7
MQLSHLIIASALSVCSLPVLATTTASVAVYATQQQQGSASIGNHSFHTKDFTVSLANLSDKNIDLNKLCLQAFAPDDKKFKLDTVDETLTVGILKPKALVKGLATFSSSDNSVYQASLVKITDQC